MEETVLSWTVPNFITVCLIAILGFAILGLIGKGVAKAKGAMTADA
jgi:hypothetical protein